MTKTPNGNNNVIPFPGKPAARIYLEVIREVADTGTKPLLAAASDGNNYWCKRLTTDHGLEATINEVAASIIGETLGAHVRPWAIIHVPEALKGQLVGKWPNRYRLTGEPLFGSLLLEAAHPITDPPVLPYITDDENYTHIPFLIALWLLCNVQEDLQLLVDHNDKRSLWSIDHGFWFDSLPTPWQFTPHDQPAGRPPIPLIRHAIPADRWNRAISSLDKLTPDLKNRLHKALPEEWAVNRKQTDAIINYVLNRKEYTRNVLEDLKKQHGR